MDLIGKFGVGFYSSFMVAKEIHITTRSWQKDGQAWLWKSTGESSYTIEEVEKEGRGTRIELLLKKEEKEFLEDYRLKNIILKHSKFVPFAIYLDQEKIERKDAIWTQPKSKLEEKTISSSTNSSKTPRRTRRPICTFPRTPRCNSPRSCLFPKPRLKCWD